MNFRTLCLTFCLASSSVFSGLTSLDPPQPPAQRLAINALHPLHRSRPQWDIVYLASFPRSGNHWVRFLIEEATGVATSSAYWDQDYPHRFLPFPWGGYCTDHGFNGTCRYPAQREPVIVKTHYPCLPKPLRHPAKRAICLIRNPIDTFYSFYVYKEKETSNLIPDKIVCEYIRRWREFYEFWERQPGVLMVRYEDLYQDPYRYLAEMIQTAGYPAGPQDIERAATRYPPEGGLLKYLAHFSKSEIDLIKHELRDLLLKYDYPL